MSKRVELKAKRAYKLIEKPQRWCKNSEAKDNRGRDCEPTDEQACRFCASGALVRVYGRNQANNLLDKLAKKLGQSIIDINDEGTHRQVYNILKKNHL